MTPLGTTTIDSPIGRLRLVSTPSGLCILTWESHWPQARADLARRFGKHDLEEASGMAALAPLEAYFAGDLGAIDSIPVDLGGTVFQRGAWAVLRRIPAGTVWTYGQQAAAMNRPKATRAVGSANGRNPVAIVVPCHRVVAAAGQLGGFSAGLEHKRWLLAHEGHRLDDRDRIAH